MAVHDHLPTPYHQQDTNDTCGGACAQMVLAAIGAGLLDQADLYTDCHNHNTIDPSWLTAPDGLQWTLNNRRPPPFPNSFAYFALDSEDAISRKIVWTIHHAQAPPVALVFGLQHWLVVCGYEASAAPTGAGDTSYSITSFDVNNPTVVPKWLPEVLPPPHGAADGCGTGGERGALNDNIAYPHWQSTYMTGVPSGPWRGKFVAVGDPDPPATRPGLQPPLPQHLRGDRLLTPDEAAERALAGLKTYGLSERELWKKVLARTSPGEPALVQRLDRLDSFYYIVPLRSGRRATPALVCVDGRFGDYLQAVCLAERGADALAGWNFDAGAARQEVLGKRIELGRRKGSLTVRGEASSLYPTLVWKPCRESFSMYYPFFLVTVGAERIYVRVDGRIFPRLHDRGRGG